MTKADVTELVAILSAAFPGSSMSERTVEVYEGMLLDLDFEAAKKAVARLVTTSRFLPTIAEIRTAAFELEQGARRLAGEAWGDVLSEIRRTGSYGVPRFVDARTAECVRLMGWRNLCFSESDAADRARFAELYDGLTERAVRDGLAGSGLALPAPRGNPIRSLIGAVTRQLPAKLEPTSEDRVTVTRELLAMCPEPEPAPIEGPSDEELRELFGQSGKAAE
jgi:hypothetical protein